MSSVIEDLAALPRFLTVKETCAFLGVSASTGSGPPSGGTAR